MKNTVEFEIALSFAGEDREYVKEVAEILRTKGIEFFYDEFEEATMWGKNLYDYLTDVYRNKAYYTIIFISENYAKKQWTNHERQVAQSRAFQENNEYILPARFDDTEIPGMLPTIGYISLVEKTPLEFAEIIITKLIASGRTVPSEQLRKSLSTLIKIPKSNPTTFSVVITNEKNEIIKNAHIFLLADNNTYLNSESNDEGIVNFLIHTRRSYKLFFSHEGYPAMIVDKIDPESDLELTIHTSENIGSVIFQSTGYIPGLQGRLNPILDTSNRTYLYADNIAINGGKPQPTAFTVGTPMELEDCDGMIIQVAIKGIQGRVSLLEFVKPIVEE